MFHSTTCISVLLNEFSVLEIRLGKVQYLSLKCGGMEVWQKMSKIMLNVSLQLSWKYENHHSWIFFPPLDSNDSNKSFQLFFPVNCRKLVLTAFVKISFLVLSRPEEQGTYGQRALNCRYWGNNLSLKYHRSRWTCQHGGPSEDIHCLHRGNTFPVEDKGKVRCEAWAQPVMEWWFFDDFFRESLSLHTPLKCCILPPYK